MRKIMGVEGACRSPNGGGVLCCMLSIYSRTPSPPPVFILLPSCQIFRQTGQKGAKINISLVGFVLPPRNRRPKTAKTKIYFTFGVVGLPVVALHLGRWSCPLVQACRLQDQQGVSSGPLVVCSLPYVRFHAMLAVDCLQICPYLAF